jgi:hypothetical protein
MGCARNRCGAAHEPKFGGVFPEPHIIEESAQVANLGRRRNAGARLRAHRVQPTQHALVPTQIHADGVEKPRLVGHKLRSELVQLGH